MMGSRHQAQFERTPRKGDCLHSPAQTRAVFDDPNLLAHAALAPLPALADRAGLAESLAGVRPAGPCGGNAGTKAMCLVAGMAAGADSIDDMDLLRDGAMDRLKPRHQKVYVNAQHQG